MSKRNGGTAQKGKRNVIQDNDVYFHVGNAFELIEHLLPHFKNIKKNCEILDACCGEKVLGKALKYNFSKSIIDYQDIKHQGISILDYFPDKLYDIIICNPPWVPTELAEKIYHHLYYFLNKKGVLIFIINNPFMYQGWERAVKLHVNKYYFLPRYTFSWMGRPLLDPGVSVSHKNNIVPKEAMELNCFINLTKIKGEKTCLEKRDHLQ